MKKILLSAYLLAFLFTSCTEREKNTLNSDIIEIEGGLQKLSKFKVSDFGKEIRYIPLETTDDCLVGNNPIVKVLQNHIIIEANQRCLLFNKRDGSFISVIGHMGQDPEAYSSPFSWADEKEGFLYFTRRPNQLIKYDMKGNFSGKTEFPPLTGLASYYLFTDSEIIGYYNGLDNTNNFVLAGFDKNGLLHDTIPPLLSQTKESLNDILNISVIKGSDTYGNLSKTGLLIIDYKNDKRQILALDAATLWMNNGNIRFKENFVDTVYTLTDKKLIPSIVFNTGKWHWPQRERMDKEHTNERIFIADVSENNTFVFFQCIKGLYSDEPILYNGLFNKETGETKLSKNSDEIQDDLTGFIPFKPLMISSSGEFISLIEAGDILEWIEKHPGINNGDKLTFLNELTEDMNPVIVLVE